ncbi:uncharacterized protein L969DRAFT_77715 [Mixia osmundae IAM 14324]|uniref:Small ribosomal subunit protein mS35 mitochondrial conserved domain-containing protein n=1 Tax=Mixia osmundae (strain CBS 9802 / IAM 14324 / JCM 22182 / KY 12970) TaxID=764103 RepID=G7DS24_MIXOS|nr:uncharacterized protein L969DRAFT_77715 [Mixia osmundae IAM 14324]KEI37562.1 hypothetical protein L969DRAFT_77715 [Mixia osmundae IAM 14324]GAA93384.1 hypothetical protein E5Q_00024 [Mixia osmundae IAM 14324]
MLRLRPLIAAPLPAPCSSTSQLPPTSFSRRCICTTTRRQAQRVDRVPEILLEPGMDMDEMEPYGYDDLPSYGHLALAKDRERLHYLRLIEFQLPLLKDLRRPFVPPAKDEVIQVRTQKWIGVPTAVDQKVAITVPINSLELPTGEARDTIRKLAGTRWDAEKDVIAISCQRYNTQEANAKWCSDTLDRLIRSARDKSVDLSDIPLDDRPTLARIKKRHAGVTFKDYPQEWLKSKSSSSSS